jgi:hypothetical protein
MLKSFLTFFCISSLLLANFHRNTSFMNVSYYSRRVIAIGCIFLFALGCKRKLSQEQVRTELKQAMLTFLESQPNFDSSKVHIKILDVTYFDNKSSYICEFKVSMKIPDQGLDTVGIMTGTVSKGFVVTKRKE